MHCNHSDKKDPLYSKHFASNGNHLNITDGDIEVKNFEREPRVNNDYAAGTALPDANKYIYEYEMSYDESEQVDYAVITQPEITHYSDSAIDLKQVVNTNKCVVHCEKYGNKLLITSCIDNLLKGAVGQAVQNMNLMMGLDEKAGLRLKASGF